MAAKDERRPFPTGGVVPAEDLVGRERTITDLLFRSYDQKASIALSAPRQVGKTSVVVELLDRVRKRGGRGVYLDCSTVVDEQSLAERLAAATYDEVRGQRGAFARLAELIGAARPVVYHADTGLAVTFFGERPRPVAEMLDKALGLADELAKTDRKRTVVAYDEFPRLAAISARIFDQIRARLQHANRNTAYIFLGSQVGMLRELFTRRRMLYRLATPIEISPPTPSEWIDYMEARFRAWGKPLRQGEAERLVARSGGHPRDLMELCSHLLVIRTAGSNSPTDIDLALDQTMKGLEATFDQIWSGLDSPKGTRLTAMRIASGRPIWGGRPRRTVQRTIERLERDGLIRKVGRGAYAFTEPLFARFIEQRAEYLSES